MAETKISALAILTTVADGDLIPIVDVSDTSMAPSGTTKKVTAAEFVEFLSGAFTATNSTAFNLQTGGQPRFNVAAGSRLIWVDPETGSIFYGLNHLFRDTSETAQRSLADGVFDQTKLRYFGRVITLAEIADPADLDLRRFGPEQVNGHTSYPYIGDAHDLGEHGTWEDLTGLGSGSLVGQVRSTAARVPYGGDEDTPGGACVESGAVIAFQTSEMPRQITPNNQMAVGMRVYVAVVPNGSQDKIEVFRIEHNGHIQIGEKSIDAGDNGALVQVRAHEGANAKHRLFMNGSPTGGNFKLTWYPMPTTITEYPTGQQTANIAWNTNAAGVQSALEALAGIAPGDVTVTGGPFPGSTIDVEYTGTLGLSRQVKLEAEDTLTGGTNPNVTVEENVVGVDKQTANKLLQMRGTPGQTADYITVKNGDDTTDVLRLDSTGNLIVPVQITAGGTFRHTGSEFGFFNTTPVTQRSAYTQTFSTASRTHAARTAAALNDNSGGTSGGTTIALVPMPADSPASADALRDDLVANTLPAIRNAIATLAEMVNKARTDLSSSAQVLNAVVNDFKALGIAT